MARLTKFKKSYYLNSYMCLSPINRSDFVFVVSILEKSSLWITVENGGEAAPVHAKAYIEYTYSSDRF